MMRSNNTADPHDIVDKKLRVLRAAINFYPRQARALILVMPGSSVLLTTFKTSQPCPSRPTLALDTNPQATGDASRVPSLKRRTRSSKEYIESLFMDSVKAGNMVKMLKHGKWS